MTDEVLPAMPTADPVVDYDELLDRRQRREREQFNSTLFNAVQRKPEVEAELQNIAKETGVPVEALRYTKDDVQQIQKRAAVDYDSLLQKYPHTTQFLSDPNNAAVAHDDVDGLSAFEKTAQGLLGPLRMQIGGVMRGAGEYGTEVIAPVMDYMRRSILGTIGPGGRMASAYSPATQINGAETLAREGVDLAQRGREEIKAARPDNFVGGLVFDIASAIPPILTGIGAGVASPPAAIGVLTTLFTGGYYEEGRTEKELTPGESAVRAAVLGPAEGLTEAPVLALLRTPVKALSASKALPEALRAFFGSATGKLMGLAGLEGVQEGVTQTINEAYDAGILGEETTLWEAVKRVGYSMLVGTGAGATIGAPGVLSEKAADKMMERQAEKDRAGKAAAAFAASDAAADAAKLRELSPEKFQQFAEKALPEDRRTVYLPLDVFETFYQSKEVDPAEAWESLTGSRDGYIEAVHAGTDLVVPYAAYLAHLLPAERQHFTPHLKTSPDALSAAELESPEVQQQIQELMALADPEKAEKAADQATPQTDPVYQTMYEQIKGAGIYDDQTAQTIARVASQKYQTRAARRGLGETPDQALGLSNLEVTTERQAAGTLAGRFTDTQLDPLLDDLRTGKRPLPVEVHGPTLTEFLRERGIQDFAGELAVMEPDKDLKAFQRKLINVEGRTLDEAYAAAVEAGYLTPNDTDATPKQGINDLLEALDADIRGDAVYSDQNRDETLYGRQQALSALDEELARRGIDLKTASNDDVKWALRDRAQTYEQPAYHGTPVTPQERKEYLQSETESKKPRARIEFLKSGGKRIVLGPKSDLTSVLHEFGHLWLDELIVDATTPGTPDQLRNDLDVLLAHFELSVRSTDGEAAIRKAIETKHHELMATSVEAYLREGRAPSEALREVFAKFKTWFLERYRELQQLIKLGYYKPLNADVRAVFDRLLATDEAIAKATYDQFNGSFEAVLPIEEMRKLGVSESKLKQYVAVLERAKEKLGVKLLGDLFRKRRAEYRAALRHKQREVDAETRQNHAYIALELLANGKWLPDGEVPEGLVGLKLDKDDLVSRYGEPYLKRLGRTYAVEGGQNADLVAAKLGYRSGDELVQALVNLVPRKEFIKAEAQRRMEVEEPDVMLDGSLSERATAALHNSRYGKVLQNELELLGELAKQPVPSQAVIKQAAQQLLDKQAVKDIRPHRCLSAERKHANQAQKLAAQGKFAEALVAKRKQALNAAMYSEALKASDLVEKADALMKKITRKTMRESIAGGGQEFLIHIEQIAHVFGYRSLSPMRAADWQPMQDFLDVLQDEGEVTAVSDRVLDAVSKKAVRQSKDLPLSELREMYEAVKNLVHLANQAKKVRRGDELVAREEAISAMVAAAEESGVKATPLPVGPRDKSWLREKREAVGGLVTNATRPEFLVEAMDGAQTGAWHDFIWGPLDRAQKLRQTLQHRLQKALVAMHDRLPKQARKDLDEKTVNILDGVSVSRATLLGIVINTGNAGNLQRLTGAGVAGPRGVHEVTEADVIRLRELLTDDELTYVQDMWDAVNSLLPDIQAHQRAMSGVPMERVEATEFTVRGKTYRGGYFPIVYDWGRSEPGAKQAEGDALQMMMAAGATRAFTSKGYTKGRAAKVKAHLLFDYASVFARHIDQVVTDIAYREPVKHISRLLRDERVRTTLRERYGDAGLNTLQGALAYSVSASSTTAGNVAEQMRSLRTTLTANVAASALGFAVPLAAANYVSGLAQGLSRVGIKGLRRGLWNTYTNRFDSGAIIKAKSSFMQGELESWDHAYEKALRTLNGKSGFGPAYKLVVLTIHRWAQYEASRAVWFGAYLNHLDETGDDAGAAKFADKVIRTTQMATGRKDVSTLERDPMFKDAMFFMGPMLVQFGALNNTLRGRGATRTAGERIAAWMILGVLAPSLYMLTAGRGPDDEDDDEELDPEEWVYWIAKNALLFPIQTLPLVGVAATTAESLASGKPANPRAAPAAQAIADMVKASFKVARDIDKYGDEGEVNYLELTEDLAKAVGPLTGLPVSQLRRTARGVDAIMEGEDEGANLGFVGLLIYGAPKPP